MVKRWVLAGTAILLAFFAIISFLYTPQRAVDTMQNAMKTGDVAVIEAIVDFPAVRKEARDLTIEIIRSDPDFAALAADPDKLAEYERVLAMQLEQQITAEAVSALLLSAERSGPEKGFPKLSEDWAIKDETWQSFTAVHADPGGQLELRFGRQGLQWRIVGFRLTGLDPATLGSSLERKLEEQG